MNTSPEYLAEHGFSPSIVERLYSKVFILTYDKGCHLFIGAGAGTASNRYGAIRASSYGPMVHAHIVSYILNVGRIPEGMCVCHRCDQGFCIRWEHLFLDTHQGNMDDMSAKGRRVALKGESNGNSKLTWEIVDEIRARYDPVAKNGERLAREFGVTRCLIRFIVQGRLWNPATRPAGC